ncbi:hypothetical protein SH661x_000373 [Planctomicrobium sp. SH661]|uniref:hypothetical protein n=1 Tax=Planctomicrobium sp. SH661 TaxID=3448124 RepID=UPI003F5B8404
MTLYRNIFENTRPYLIATATGAALCSMTLCVNAQQSPGAATSAAPQATNSAEPKLLPQNTAQFRPLQEAGQPVFLTAGESLSSNDYRQAQQLGQSADQNGNNGNGSRGQRQTAFADRLGKIFRKTPNTPPVDPGMSYPKASDMPTPPPQAPGVSTSNIPSIPPTYGAATPQPALFQPANSVNAIEGNAIPPSPPAIPVQVAQPEIPAVPPAAPNGVQLQNIPELKALMVSDETPAVKQPEPVQTANLPKLDLNAPLPGAGPQIAPGEPSEPVMAQQTPKGSDPFADLFPGDKPQTAQAQPDAKSAAGMNQPYTGLSLETEVAKAPPEIPALPEILPPPPAEEKIEPAKVAQSEDAPVVKPRPTLEIKTAQADEPKGPPPAPGVPNLDLTIPDQLPQLTNTPPVEMEIKPANPKLLPIDPPAAPPVASSEAPRVAPPAAPPVAPPAQDDQRSKLDQIAARKDLKGLKGFCPVVLRDERNLVDSSFEFIASHNGREYSLSSAEARSKFLAEPAKYAPAAGGCDVIHLALTGEQLEGSLEHAVWYKGRLYLFSGIETMETFVAAPSSHATDD